MPDGEKSSGELGQKVCSDWFIIETIKTFLIGQFTARWIYAKTYSACREQWRKWTKHRKNCAINGQQLPLLQFSFVQRIWQHRFVWKNGSKGKCDRETKRSGKDPGARERWRFPNNKNLQEMFPKGHRTCESYRWLPNICLQSKEIQIAGLDNARLKRGRKPSKPTKEPLGKRRPTVPTEFTMRHFDTTTMTPADQASHEECSSELRVQISSLFSCEQVPTNTRDILPLPVASVRSASSPDRELNKQQASEILTDAGLRNSQVRFIILFLRFQIN